MLRLAADTVPDAVYALAVTLENSAAGQPSPRPILLEARSGDGARERLLPVEEMVVPGGIRSPFIIAGFTNKTIAQVSARDSS